MVEQVASETCGARIREMLAAATSEVAVVAPFVKTNALSSLLSPVPRDVHVSCITRWLPRDVAAGVSDPGVLDLLENRGNAELFLVDALHAKMFVADRRCLAGSANVTTAGLGEGVVDNNIEVLVETTIDDPSVEVVLEELLRIGQRATPEMAEAVIEMAKRSSIPEVRGTAGEKWFPRSRRPQDAFGLYSRPRKGFLKASVEAVMKDVAELNIQPGLSESDFRGRVRATLMDLDIMGDVIGDGMDGLIRLADVYTQVAANLDDEVSIDDLWRSFVGWLTYYCDEMFVQQDVVELAIRRARSIQ